MIYSIQNIYLLLLKNIDPADIYWSHLSSNPNAIDLLKTNQEQINWNKLSTNPAIFKAV
jgi:hypothetical protein